jgi:hypothetical protein
MSVINLPKGTWQIYGNEEQGQLVIVAVDNQGKLTGTAFGDNITGSFNASSGEIHFGRRIKQVADWQEYTGYISLVALNVDAPRYLLAGFYTNIPFELGVRFGWYATITRPLVGK